MKMNILLIAALWLQALNAGDHPNNKTSIPHDQPGGQTFLTGGGCASIPGVGSPILMISNAHKFIEDNLKIQNSYSTIKYIHFVKVTTTTGNILTNYKIAFSLTDFNGTKFIAVDIDQSPFGIGSTKINRFLMTPDANRVRQFIDINFNTRATFSCGDLKFVYSSFGNDPTAQHGYLFPGRNQNSTGLAVLNNLNSTEGKPVGKGDKTCVTANYIATTNFFGATTATTPTDMISCNPKGPSVAMIVIACSNNAVVAIQLFFTNLNDSGTTMSPFAGNPTAPINTLIPIDLKGAEKISMTSTSTPASLNIKTMDKNNTVMQDVTCGAGVGTPKTNVMMVSDFLGFGDIYSSPTSIDALDLVTYG